MSRVNLEANGRSTIATLVIVGDELLNPGTAGLSRASCQKLKVGGGETVQLSHPRPVTSLRHVRSKIYGNTLTPDQFSAIIADVADGRYMDVQIAAFVTACTSSAISLDETVHLTRAMVDVGERLVWDSAPIVDKHCVGGLPGNRTTPIVVSIAAANGLTMPKTSSRAITSASGTADTMETLAPVDLDLLTMQHVVESEGGCIVWGGSVSLSPADDALIRVERALDIDSEGQLVASVLSKKIAAGSTDVVIDIPVGPTAKVRSQPAAENLKSIFLQVGSALGINAHVLLTDGRQPVGYGIGPALEARDVLEVLRCEPNAPEDLRERAIQLAAVLLETAGVVEQGSGTTQAIQTIDTGLALQKFVAICEAQGGFREPPASAYHFDMFAKRDGVVQRIDNRLVGRIAKLAGAPVDKAAGVRLLAKLGTEVRKGDVLMTIHAESPGELEYALEFAAAQRDAIQLGDAECIH